MTGVCDYRPDQFSDVMGDARGSGDSQVPAAFELLFTLYTRKDAGGEGPSRLFEVRDLVDWWEEQIEFDEPEDVWEHILVPLSKGQSVSWAGNEYTPVASELLAQLMPGIGPPQ